MGNEIPIVATTSFLQLKLQNSSKIFEFIEWYEMAYQTTNPDTGRKRKGNGKKHLIEEIENVISSGSLQKNLLIVLVSLKKHLYFHQKLEKQNLN